MRYVSLQWNPFYLHVTIIPPLRMLSPQYFDSSDDRTIQQYIAGFSNPAGNGIVRVKQAVRSVVTETHSVFLINRFIDRLASTGKSNNLAQLQERRWIVVSDSPSDGGDCGSSKNTSVIQSYYTMRLEVLQDDCESSFWNSTVLASVMIPILDGDMSKLSRKLESILIEQGMKSRNQPEPETTLPVRSKRARTAASRQCQELRKVHVLLPRD